MASGGQRLLRSCRHRKPGKSGMPASHSTSPFAGRVGKGRFGAGRAVPNAKLSDREGSGSGSSRFGESERRVPVPASGHARHAVEKRPARRGCSRMRRQPRPIRTTRSPPTAAPALDCLMRMWGLRAKILREHQRPKDDADALSHKRGGSPSLQKNACDRASREPEGLATSRNQSWRFQ